MNCPNCGHINQPGAKFCGVCGQALSAPLPQVQPYAPALADAAMAFAAPGGAKLLMQSGYGAGQEYPLQSITTIGRSSQNDIALSDDQASRQHAEIRERGGSYIIADLGSSNGTFVNGQPVTRERTLQLGDQITIGETILTFYGSQNAPAIAQTPMPDAGKTRMAQPGPYTPSPPPPAPAQPVPKQKPKENAFARFIEGDLSAQVEGTILHIDGPHMEKADDAWLGCLMMGGLVYLLGPIALLAKFDDKVPTRYLRVQDMSGQEHIVKLKGELQQGHVSMGDEVICIGSQRGGTLIMAQGMNTRTGAEIVVDAYIKAKRNRTIFLGLMIMMLLCITSCILTGILGSFSSY